MKKLTVFTPTYNRAYCLGDLYESLCRQTSGDFLWLVIDDGSSDGTAALVAEWMEEGKIEIRYHYKENGGMHTGYNAAYELIDTELNMCMDSDDYCPDNAVELIVDCWEKLGSDQYAGILALDCLKNGEVIGDRFPEDLKETTVGDFYWIHRLKGDKKLIYRTAVVKKYERYPEFQGEKFVPIFCMPFRIDQDYKMLTLNEVVCIVDYREDGSTKNIVQSYFKNAKGFNYARTVRMRYSPSFRDRFRNAIHYVSGSIIAKNKNFVFESPKRMMTFFAVPFGVVLYAYLQYLIRKKKKR
ncbi:glycosyltransferase family 2 protein [Chryseobacterium salivictor]|uniref:Teichoic acid poly(Glycerol phosphate) polymerase n=1 Tax=Chryseobacterium salivictor TaxID=2547600 RepID=A0A4P6ZFJ2_9FLAO|nr:glycosyltransferase family A protein [Chryseobacterium salivictor]QBO58371.1 Teichoic acid poly(glycerol phosphate) polymerase [Chryseobacterium salivictor]